ncbi:MAG: PIN domain-containing protein [Microcystis aeruginosa Ma_QC_Ch_20071001_S25D]|uniref:PIN domain-containing protein n=1 Tax=Microcystis aeruginosa Ma_QC_Ch_20071001_S25D TaxID=2486250 RepID=A0A552G104_MICAE|nr:MAG: PIN domain-containing protein [Microcystis aeruginosa Ma_QC_Ch_20071001_S25D]
MGGKFRDFFPAQAKEYVELSLCKCDNVPNFGRTLQEWIQQALTVAKIDIFSITPEIAIRAVNLSPIHKDPFDRIIMATALAYGGKLASIDHLFPKYVEIKDHLMERAK